MSSSSRRHGITATAYNRPDKLQNLLASIARAREARSWPVYISIEPSEREAENLAVIDSFRDRLDIRSRVNAQRKGVRQNPFDTVEWALADGLELVLLLEDDLVIEPQALVWSAQLAAQALDRPDVLCANLLLTTCNSESIHVPPASELEALALFVLRTRFFSSYGLLFSARQWRELIRPNWFSDEPRMENWRGDTASGWDVAVNRALLTRADLVVLQSLVPRVKHDGAGGTHMSPGFQARSFDNVALSDTSQTPLPELVICDPLDDLEKIPSAQARMYINLCRHLWTLQEQSLRFKHAHSDIGNAKGRRFRLGSYDYLVFRTRARR